ncbi:MAG TPA: alpha/beta fold hydrolase, partial [Actinomycetota bacterium]|nr:alpha/beta fold hydrolase [Actinomycetota bacterium]
LAIDTPEKVGRLVLVGANPGIVDETKRHARRTADERWIRLLREEGLDVFLAKWLVQPMFGGFTQEEIIEMGQKRSRSDSEALASSLELAGVGIMAPMWERLRDIAHETLIIVGSKDRKFSAIADQMAGKIPNSQIASIAGAGHAAHLEDPIAFGRLVREFLEGHVATPDATSQ